MNIVWIAAIAVAGTLAILLLVLLWLVLGLRKSVARLSDKPTSGGGSGTLLQFVAGQLEEIESQIGKFDIVFSDIQKQLGALQRQGSPSFPPPSPAAPRARAEPQVRPPEPSPVPPATPLRQPAEPAERPVSTARHLFPPAAATEVPAAGPVTQPTPPPPPAPSDSAAGFGPIIEQYRRLIAQPRKSEINRWSDDLHGQSCEVSDDGVFQQVGREAGGLLVLLTLDDRTGIVVPAGRLVVDFPTSFANVISMRSVTRQSFELVNDGTGVLRLIEPAVVQRSGDTWKLMRAGKLAGLASD